MKYRITMWNPDAEEKSKVVVEKEVNGNRIDFREFVSAIWAYVTRQPFLSAETEHIAIRTMKAERSMFFPILFENVGDQAKLSANNDDYTEYLFERLE